MKTLYFRHNHETILVNPTDKINGFERITIKGVRWHQKTYGNTYHKAYISALVDGYWTEIGHSSIQYGYGNHYLVTAGEWLLENGYIECASPYFLADQTIRQALNVDDYSVDVSRKRDL